MIAAAIAAGLAIVALAVLLGLTVVQNRDLPARLKATGRPPWRVLGAALALWSPLAAAIGLAVLVTQLAGAVTAALVHRFTPLEAWCVAANAVATPTIPCSGRARNEPLTALQHVPQRETIEREVLDRYASVLDRLQTRAVGHAPAGHDMDWRLLEPTAVLGLEKGPQDDPELRRMRRELREMLDAPVAPPASPLDLMRFRGDMEIRTRRLRELTHQVKERNERLARAAYGGLSSQAMGTRWLRHRLAHRLLVAQWPVEDLQRIAPPAGAAPPAATAARRQRAKLVADAAATLDVLAQEDANRLSRAALGLAIPTPPRCRFRDGPAVDFRCPRLASGTTQLRLRRLSTADSVRLSLDHWRESARRDALRVLGRTGLVVRRDSAAAADALRGLPQALRRRWFGERAPCVLARPAVCVGNAIAASFEHAVVEPADWGGAAVQHAGESLAWPLADTTQLAWTRIDEMHARSAVVAKEALRLHALVATFGWLLLAFLALKSFLYVLGLEAFRLGGLPTLGFDGTSGVKGSVRVGRRLTLDPAIAGPLVTHRQLSNSDNHLRLAPWPGSAPIGRLLCGRYFWFTRGSFLSAGAAAGPHLGQIASADAGQAIVEWRMRPGEEVVFAWRNFFGASEGLQFRTQLSLRLSTLLLGRVLFRIARCPPEADGGILLLRADVEQGDNANLQAVPPERLLAWNRQARFRAHGAESAFGVLVHGVTLVREADAGGIVLATSEDRGPRFGSLRFVRRLFTAIF